MDCIFPSHPPVLEIAAEISDGTMPAEDLPKVCRKCGIEQSLARFPFRKDTHKHRGTCKACRAAESHALRHHPDHAGRIREAERVRSLRRRAAILKWQREHPDNMRPGRQRRWARRKARLAAARLAAATAGADAQAPTPTLGG